MQPPNSARLIEDLIATLPLYIELNAKGRAVLPSTATLAALGQTYLDSYERREHYSFLDHPEYLCLTEELIVPTGIGEVRLSCFLAGIVLARRDVWSRFQVENEESVGIDWPQCLQWLIMHGLLELNLFRFCNRRFLSTLQSETVVFRGGVMTPLEWIVSRERPEWLAGSVRSDRDASRGRVQRWLESADAQALRALFDKTRVRRRHLSPGIVRTWPQTEHGEPHLQP